MNPTAMTVLQRIALPLILLQLCLISQTIQSQQQTLCVQASSNSTPSSECKSLMDWYSNNSTAAFASNTKLLFQKGIHHLQKFLYISNCHNFTLAGNGSALHHGDGLSQPTSIINCSREHDSGLYISNSSIIHIHNLELRFCSGHYTLNKHNFTGSLVFLYVQDVSLSQVVVNKPKGYGLHATNIFGNNKVIDSAFLYASRHHHSKPRNSGNAIFFFDEDTNTTLVVDSSWFMYGKSYYDTSGLKLTIHCTRIQVSLLNVTAQGNVGYYGNLAISVLESTDSRVIIDNSHIVDGRAHKGAGLEFRYVQSSTRGTTTGNEVHNILIIQDTIFRNNSVEITGGAMYVAYDIMSNTTLLDSLVRQILISDCNFTENIGNGAAMEIVQFTRYRMPNFLTSIKTCKFDDNSTPSRNFGPILEFISVEVLVADCTFTRSNTTVISIRNSYLRLFGDILFENNSAIIGGALKLCDTSLVFANMGATVSFVNNFAKKGGAIYVQHQCMDTRPMCFLQPSVPTGMPLVDVIKTINFEFRNNSASIAGDVLYGGNIDQCSTIRFYRWNTTDWRKDYRYNKEIFDKIFTYQNQHRQSLISSDPRGVCFCRESRQYNYNHTCIASKDPIKKYPGEIIIVPVITVGQMNGSTLGVITAKLLNENENHTLVRLTNPGSSANCVNLTFKVKSNREIAHINFKPVTLEMFTIIILYGTIFPNVTIHLQECPVGFELSDRPPYKCICNPILSKFLLDNSKVKCNISSNTISIQQRRMWLGCLDPESKNQSSTCDNLVVAPNCDYYCHSATNDSKKVIDISIMHADSQCSPGHTGILCGACKPGYSRILGGALECQKGCTNRNLPIVILFFLTFNILLVIFIMFLNITVTEVL